MMGIYIKGMEMPEHGRVINIYADGRVSNHFDEFCETIATAVPVPPHGRLIDADEVMSRVDEGDDVMFVWAITDAPTIIPAEE